MSRRECRRCQRPDRRFAKSFSRTVPVKNNHLTDAIQKRIGEAESFSALAKCAVSRGAAEKATGFLPCAMSIPAFEPPAVRPISINFAESALIGRSRDNGIHSFILIHSIRQRGCVIGYGNFQYNNFIYWGSVGIVWFLTHSLLLRQ
jgi:hypothetical protein